MRCPYQGQLRKVADAANLTVALSVVTPATTAAFSTPATVSTTATAAVVAPCMVAVMVVTAVMTGVLGLIVVTLLLAGGDTVVALVAVAGFAFDRIIVVLFAGAGILAFMIGYDGSRWTTVIGDLICECIRRHENA
ncbi:Uncharacterized protein MLTONO_3798 [Mesorhizobium loti]|nr:Uncharacterized protein MLTONO_3798 [Mesorhizobium loti]